MTLILGLATPPDNRACPALDDHPWRQMAMAMSHPLIGVSTLMQHLILKTTRLLTPCLALLSLAATTVANAEIVPDEIEVRGANACALTEGARISPDELISIHRFKLGKGKWDISYKPGGVANIPFVWKQLPRDYGRNPQATIKMFKGRYNDKVKNLDLVLYIAPNGLAEIDVHDLDKGTKVRYSNLGHTDFFKAVYENN